MTVLDRSNERLTLAEQSLSANGNYSDEDYIKMGNMTNARYIVAGNIRNISGRYIVTFRINNTETNEIRASFNNQYTAQDIESGLAAKEAVRELLLGMGIELTAEGERRLTTIPETEVTAQRKLAQGMSAERNNNPIQALVYFQEALNADRGMQEASQHIQNFGQGSPGASIRERAEWANTQKARWEKIFDDLIDYINDNLIIAVYDFSNISDRFDARTNTVTLTVTPGIKIIPDSMVLSIWKTIVDQWEQISNLEENRSWTRSVHSDYGRKTLRISTRHNSSVPPVWRQIGLNPLVTDGKVQARIRLYDADGIRIASITSDRSFDHSSSDSLALYRALSLSIQYSSSLQILPQIRYFNDKSFAAIRFNGIRITDITDELSVKVEKLREIPPTSFSPPARIMSVQEWNQWVQGRR